MSRAMNLYPLSNESRAGAERGRRRVLCIEDNLANLRLVSHVIAMRSDTELLSATRGVLGLELARKHCPDLILLDVQLPDISGLDVLSRLKAEPATRHIPVLVLSADNTPDQIQRLLQAGAADYVTKPFDLKAFLALLDEMLQNAGANKSKPPA